MSDLWQREPALMANVIIGVVDAAIVLAVAFGLPISPEQRTAILGFASAVLVLVSFLLAGVVVRGRVRPMAKIPDSS